MKISLWHEAFPLSLIKLKERFEGLKLYIFDKFDKETDFVDYVCDDLTHSGLIDQCVRTIRPINCQQIMCVRCDNGTRYRQLFNWSALKGITSRMPVGRMQVTII